ncbi:MAG: hypothetical protein OXF41_10310 [bacterium]|nr:hypothetical protein [bacterium]
MSNRLLAAHRMGIERAGAREVVVLDSPFGFQENAPLLAERLTRFFRTSFGVDASVASYRSVDDGEVTAERMVAAVRRARYVFAGPGSPSYALGVWKGAGLAKTLQNRLATGATVTLASAAALTAGVKTLPVYEIYKVGAELTWLEGMNVAGDLGMEAVVVPHWNNTEGQGFDTSRCYMGRRRFGLLRSMLPSGVGVIGLDEHTAGVFDFGKGELSVLGVGRVTLSGSEDLALRHGERIDLARVFELLGSSPEPVRVPPAEPLPTLAEALEAGSAQGIATTLLAVEARASAGSEAARRQLRAMVLEVSDLVARGLITRSEWVGDYVDLLVRQRSRLRAEKRWDEADRLRADIESLGVALRDTRAGTVWRLME